MASVSGQSRRIDSTPTRLRSLADYYPDGILGATREGVVIKLYAAGPSEVARPGDAGPGVVVAVDEAGMHVCCGDGVVRIGELQVPGKRRMPARDYAVGRPFGPGERLGT